MTVTVITAVLVFTLIILVLVLLLNYANAKLVQPGPFTVDVNSGKKTIQTGAGKTVLQTLTDEGLFLPAACGGSGTCGMCKCKITEGAGDVLPTEDTFLSRAERKSNMRMACQVKVRNDLKMELPEAIFGIRKYEVKVKAVKQVAAFMKDIEFEVPDEFQFVPGQYIQIDIPAYSSIAFKDLVVPEEYKEVWDRYKLSGLVAKNPVETVRGYSIASSPHEKGIVMIRVRLATPPNKPGIPPGIGSSWIFNLKAGDDAVLSGPFGEEFCLKDTDREMCFIASGAGLGPMRGHIYYLFHALGTKRKVTFWYGARSVKECCWSDNFPVISRDFDNFDYHISLSRPREEDKWDGFTGHIHKVVAKEYLEKHRDPGNIEYYLCGPTPMMQSTLKMLYDLGVEQEMIAFDEF
jgi:Na+-transporting NADH:ubiquinone oxidoreductase subunit F